MQLSNDMSRIRYQDSRELVQLGDRIILSGLLRKTKGVVVHVPGLSPPHKDFGDEYFEEVGIKTEKGTYVGVLVEPETNFVKKSLVFVSRGSDESCGLPESLDDPFER